MAPTIPDQYEFGVENGQRTRPDVRKAITIAVASKSSCNKSQTTVLKCKRTNCIAMKDEKLRKINQRVVLTTETLGEVLANTRGVKKPNLLNRKWRR